MPQIDHEAAQTWHFPTNKSERTYQFEIVKRCLHENCLVTLPTGLGKTFIAAVVMYNYYRWYPNGKTVFLAPTRPLVSQQIEAVQELVEIAEDDLAELTGNIIPSVRESCWKHKRAFFMTPQILHNDLLTGSCPAKDIVLIVIDEAHKASGKHAYCEVIRQLYQVNPEFRILALTATPAISKSSIQTLLDNLQISHIEFRTENSSDVQPYVFQRISRNFIVDDDHNLSRVKDIFIEKIMKRYWEKLTSFNAINLEIMELSSYKLMLARDTCRMRMQGSSYMGAIEGYFAILMSLCHLEEILSLHGIIPFFNSLKGIDDQSSDFKYSRVRLKTELENNPSYHELINLVKELQNQPNFVSHPKIVHTENIILENFKESPLTKAIIFSQYRESVFELVRRLNRHAPVIKAMSFIGQSSTGSGSNSFTQKQQLQVLKTFRDGGYNVLVSTCIGEEGLDIGDVDLIICYDMQSSPIRHIQRIGRTGRHGVGNVVILLSRGREEQKFKSSTAEQNSLLDMMSKASRIFRFHKPWFDPLSVHSECIKRKFLIVDKPCGKKPRMKKDQNDRSLPVSFEKFNFNLLQNTEKPEFVVQRSHLPVHNVKHSIRTNTYINLIQERSQLTTARRPIDEIFNSWRKGVSNEELLVFFSHSNDYFNIPKITETHSGSLNPIVLLNELTIEDVPDDFFDDENEIEPKLSPMKIEKDYSPSIPIGVKKRNFVIDSSCESTPIRVGTRNSVKINDLRYFIESQAVEDDRRCLNDSDEAEQYGSDLSSFIDDEDDMVTEGEKSQSSMMGFYRQSLFQSQPWNGFDNGSKHLDKRSNFKKSKLEANFTSELSIIEEDSAGLGNVDWDAIEEEFL